MSWSFFASVCVHSRFNGIAPTERGPSATLPYAPTRLIARRLKTPLPTPAPKRPHLLVVDDAKAVRRLAQQALDAFDCEVSEATNGFNALFQMERGLPDLILLDVSMPVMDGLEMLTMLKSKAALAAIPVIMLVSPADHRVSAQIAALGVRGTLTKPFTGSALVEKITAVVDLRRRPAPSDRDSVG